MNIYQTKDYAHMSKLAANMMTAHILLKPDCRLGLATGSTPIGTYQQLVAHYRQGDVDFSKVCSVNLDEYKGMPPDHPQSYRYFMQHHLFQHVNIPPIHTHLPNGLAEDAAQECSRYDSVLRAVGGIDLQLLGLGNNGHIGFNEPSTSFAKTTHCVDLTESTVEANKRFFKQQEDVPRQAYTMGIASIMQARHILVLVSGEGKAEIVQAAFMGPITPQVPASILQLHANVTVIGDAPALSLLPSEVKTVTNAPIPAF